MVELDDLLFKISFLFIYWCEMLILTFFSMISYSFFFPFLSPLTFVCVCWVNARLDWSGTYCGLVGICDACVTFLCCLGSPWRKGRMEKWGFSPSRSFGIQWMMTMFFLFLLDILKSGCEREKLTNFWQPEKWMWLQFLCYIYLWSLHCSACSY